MEEPDGQNWLKLNLVSRIPRFKDMLSCVIRHKLVVVCVNVRVLACGMGCRCNKFMDVTL